ncbi:MAG: Alkane 1-monooxygenase, partial [Pseudomonadota bacterium]
MSTPALAHEQPWQDKRWWWLLSPAIPLIFTASMWAALGTGVWWCMLLAPFIIHVLLPLLDRVFGEDFSNPPESAVAQLDGDVFYRALA